MHMVGTTREAQDNQGIILKGTMLIAQAAWVAFALVFRVIIPSIRECRNGCHKW